MSIRWVGMILFLFVLTACSNEDEVTPDDVMKEYVDNWNEQKFSEMYDMLSNESRELYPTEKYVDRYQKIYNDLQVENLDISFEGLSEEEQKTSLEEGKATIPINVKMTTLAGPIEFQYETTLVQQDSEDEKSWNVTWDPGLIFPALKDGGDIRFETEYPKRGEIFDRNGNGLAVNAPIYEIGVVPSKLGDDPDQMKEKIASLLTMDIESIETALNAGWVQPDLFVPLKKVPTTYANLEKLWELEPVMKKDTTGRLYPYGKATAHLTGYIGKITAEELNEMEPGVYSQNDVIGKRGLEQLFESRLKGEKGIKVVVTQEEANKEDVILAEKPVKHGEDITLTINADIQKAIYTSYQENAGTAASINPKTGQTLALVSSPAFDPNDLTYGISQEQWSKLQEDPNKPLINRFAATYSPGSTFKPITASIGLKSGVIKPGEGIEIDGLTWKKDNSWGNYEVKRVSESNEPVDVTDALIRSDNIYFAKKAVEMGSDTLTNGLKSFGFGEDFPFEYPIESSSITSSGSISSEVQLADTGYGQGQIQLSALHLATAYTPILNDGNLIKPTLELDAETSQVWSEDLLTTDQAQLIQEALRKVVSAPNGTARGANVEDLTLSGKTGTAELKKSGEEKGQENGWFVAYPTNEQDILIAMMVEKIENEQGGSGYVVNKVTDIFKQIK
ncbi:penicillin-binding transpeptidase domain-containing protein [Aquibacillus sp. 3ASR75-11]|uniref:serine-type D-Ala-D-Ala carboxypeptidase n=1 Tax=Terrihalobacillus insolitus TaxID=2950438 RepID=A0A9X4AKR3_9BACI|nr:penicillin-binding transpeptidase domain-containing protein [Terrihalobacillus insolitus]MDC3412207.1 penicillin-binding transpeptidase domain-containing protein [Terrihalobacillus insolitus]MDC3423099.1 penicillin-binding transpeptidase domain-containing protein [Terrihalobacillus insolitus]